jgi:phosphoribosylamine---glycine ligase
VVIEEFLEGEEASFIVLCDGVNALALATSQDHKRLLDADQGPNTGGMGAYSPAPVVTPAVHQRAMDEVILPTLRGMAADGIPYTGFLYAGLMITPDGRVKTLEFNCRMGDPGDPADHDAPAKQPGAGAAGRHPRRAGPRELDWDPRVALGVVLAAAGYPMNPRKGDAITGLPADEADRMVFHAGTADADGQVVAPGGRVLCATVLADTVAEAQKQRLRVVDGIRLTACSAAATSATGPFCTAP